MNKPEVNIGLGSFSYFWAEISVRVVIDRLEDEGIGEISVFQEKSGKKTLLHISRLNLLSTQSCSQLAKKLDGADIKGADWTQMLTYVTALTLQELRRGEPAVPIGKKPELLKVEYQLAPVLERNQPTTLYGPGGSAKSYLADYIAVLVQLNYVGITSAGSCWMPTAGNVLYLDWEASKQDHERRVWLIKRGLGIDTEETFLYRFCSQPLVSDIHAIQSLVFENKIDLVIIDSQMAATGYGLDPAQVASQYYNALRSLKCTTLTIDHVSKEDWKGNSDSVGPYGSVVKYNRSRSQFELRKSQNAGDDYLELSLIHRKHNEGKLLKPIGIRINFNQGEDDRLESVTFERCNVADNPELSKTLSMKDQIVQVLKRGKLEVKAISEQTGIPEATVRARLNDNKKLFKHFSDGWGLLS